MDPHDKRDRDERRLTALKVGTVGLTVAGLGIFAGLAAAGTDDAPAPTPGSVVAGTADQSAVDAARAAESDSFFDDQAQGGAVGGYQGYAEEGSAASNGTYGDDDHGDWEHHDGERHGHHGPPPGGHGGDDSGYGGAGGGYGGDGASGSMPGGMGNGASQGSSGGS